MGGKGMKLTLHETKRDFLGYALFSSHTCASAILCVLEDLGCWRFYGVLFWLPSLHLTSGRHCVDVKGKRRFRLGCLFPLLLHFLAPVVMDGFNIYSPSGMVPLVQLNVFWRLLFYSSLVILYQARDGNGFVLTGIPGCIIISYGLINHTHNYVRVLLMTPVRTSMIIWIPDEKKKTENLWDSTKQLKKT